MSKPQIRNTFPNRIFQILSHTNADSNNISDENDTYSNNNYEGAFRYKLVPADGKHGKLSVCAGVFFLCM